MPFRRRSNLSLGTAATFPPFQAGAARDYAASTTATVISSAGDSALSVADPTGTGRLVNGAFSLAQPVQVRAKTGAFAPLGAATPLLAYSAPVSNDQVTIDFSQSIGANEALRTGTYAKTLTFTLSTTNP